MEPARLVVPWQRARRFAASRGNTVLAADAAGFVDGPETGLFVSGTRVLSRYGWLLGGKTPPAVALGNATQDRWLGYYRSGGIELLLDRRIEDGLRERVALTSWDTEKARVRLELDAGREGTWKSPELRLEGATIRFDAGPLPVFEEGRPVFEVELSPGETWRAELRAAPRGLSPAPAPWFEPAAFETPESGTLAAAAVRALERAAADLEVLRDAETPPGLAWQAALLAPALLRRTASDPVRAGFAAGQLWHWTGDRAAVASLLDPALAGLERLERHGPFYCEGSRAPTCELQAWVYLAQWSLAEVLWWFKRRHEARRLFREARDLARRFDEAFWIESEGTYAAALDGKRAIGSQPGHCLAAAIVPAEKAVRVAGRLVANDLFSGWGIRTLSSHDPSYDPIAHRRGALWPSEQGTFSIGFARYGLRRHVELLARAQLELSQVFQDARVPEPVSGHARDEEHPFPAFEQEGLAPRPVPAVFCHVQALLGVYPFAPLRALLVDPHLPEWLPELTVRGLRVANARVSLRFARGPSGTDFEVLENEGRLRIVRQPNPWSRTATFGERLRDALESVTP